MRTVSLVKLDKRHSHNRLFSYMYKFHGTQVFHDALFYCNQQWGPTVDVETYALFSTDSKTKFFEFKFAPQWSYLCKYSDQRIYLTDDALTWIKLSQPWDI